MRAQFVSLRHHMQWLGVRDKVRKVDSAVPPHEGEGLRIKDYIFIAYLYSHSLAVKVIARHSSCVITVP